MLEEDNTPATSFEPNEEEAKDIVSTVNEALKDLPDDINARMDAIKQLSDAGLLKALEKHMETHDNIVYETLSLLIRTTVQAAVAAYDSTGFVPDTDDVPIIPPNTMPDLVRLFPNMKEEELNAVRTFISYTRRSPGASSSSERPVLCLSSNTEIATPNVTSRLVVFKPPETPAPEPTGVMVASETVVFASGHPDGEPRPGW